MLAYKKGWIKTCLWGQVYKYLYWLLIIVFCALWKWHKCYHFELGTEKVPHATEYSSNLLPIHLLPEAGLILDQPGERHNDQRFQTKQPLRVCHESGRLSQNCHRWRPKWPEIRERHQILRPTWDFPSFQTGCGSTLTCRITDVGNLVLISSFALSLPAGSTTSTPCQWTPTFSSRLSTNLTDFQQWTAGKSSRSDQLCTAALYRHGESVKSCRSS